LILKNFLKFFKNTYSKNSLNFLSDSLSKFGNKIMPICGGGSICDYSKVVSVYPEDVIIKNKCFTKWRN